MDRDALSRLGRAALPILAIGSFVLGVAVALGTAGATLGYDYQAYLAAAERLVEGQSMYDVSAAVAGPFGVYLYPPPFAIAFVPFTWMPESVALAVWIGCLIAATVIAIAILPVSPRTRWVVLLLAGWNWPVVYAIKLGQVGPILLLIFAVGWRLMASPVALGVSAALGTTIKLQPALILAWTLLTRRFRATWIGLVVLGGLAVAATLLASPGVWSDYVTVIRAVSDPITTPHNFTPGAVAYQLGVSDTLASVVQMVSLVASIGVFLVAVRRATDEASFLVAIVASQLLSPVLWDHYALLLLLPVAYLLSGGRGWAIAIPLATTWPLLAETPAVIYPLVFWIALLATAVVGIGARRSDPGSVTLASAPA